MFWPVQKTAASIGEENLRKPEIAKALQEAKEARAERVKVDQDYVLNTIVSTIERCAQARPVTDKSGNPVLAMTPDGEIAPVYSEKLRLLPISRPGRPRSLNRRTSTSLKACGPMSRDRLLTGVTSQFT